MALKETPSQTAGPYLHIGCTPHHAGLVPRPDLGAQLRSAGAAGQKITLTGRILDGAGAAATDAMVELWQADAAGRFATMPGADPHFTGWGRSPCDHPTDGFRFETVKPGPITEANGTRQAPHALLWIVARGVNIALQTRVYFADEPDANALCPVLSQVPVARRPTLLATPKGAAGYHLDIHLQGPRETVFFDM